MGQTDILGVAVRDTAGHRIHVSGKCLLRRSFMYLVNVKANRVQISVRAALVQGNSDINS